MDNTTIPPITKSPIGPRKDLNCSNDSIILSVPVEPEAPSKGVFDGLDFPGISPTAGANSGGVNIVLPMFPPVLLNVLIALFNFVVNVEVVSLKNCPVPTLRADTGRVVGTVDNPPVKLKVGIPNFSDNDCCALIVAGPRLRDKENYTSY